jgi:microcystin-dependent protein
MSETTTPFLGLIKPPIGADADVWGDRLNTNSDTLDANASSIDARVAALEAAIANIPKGEEVASVKFWPGGALPTGWLNCDGASYPTTTYPDLFTALGYAWGGSGANFNVPDMRGSIPVGLDQGTNRLQGQYGAVDQVGRRGGVAVWPLQPNEMPPHQHTGSTNNSGPHTHGVAIFGPVAAGSFIAGQSPLQAAVFEQTSTADGDHSHTFVTSVAGSGSAHGNCQPGVLGLWIIKAVQS